MSREEEEMSLTKWRDLLGTELIIALEELAKIQRDVGKETPTIPLEKLDLDACGLNEPITLGVGFGQELNCHPLC
jgi:hypothetical protein